MNFRHLGLALVFSAALAACGGGDSGPTLKRVVSFGDSLSDLGAYSPATSLAGTGAAPFFGGRFTTNSHTGYTAASNTNTATVWVEWIAATLGVPISPHEAGFLGQSLKCPAAPSPAAAAAFPLLADTCTGYGMGGSRVTDANGIGKTGGALTVPMVTQVANHQTRFGNFRDSDLVLVYGGNNDVFVQFGAAGAGLPVATATANVQAAATELAALVKDQILAKGATHVAVMNLPDSSLTPFGATLTANGQALLSSLSAAFNTSLDAALAGAAVHMIDARALSADARSNPAKYGLANVTVPTCDAAKISAITAGRVTDGSSLFCNSAAGQAFNGIRTGADVNTWLFADGVHPTVKGHKVFADAVIADLRAFGWIK